MSAKGQSPKPSKQSKERVRLSKTDCRAQQQGWSDSERQARKRIAQILRHCRYHYRNEAPVVRKLMVTSIAFQIKRALSDCKQLDLHRAAMELPPMYVEAFTFYNSEGALVAIHLRALDFYNETRKKKMPWLAAAAAGDERKALSKMTLELIKESVRDLWSAEQALVINSAQIHGRIAEGNLGFFIDLGEFLRKNRTSTHRNYADWILRAWLPLCLWECERDGVEAHDRCVEAGSLIGLQVPDYKQFKTAWKNVRDKKMKLSS